jgi:chemotaxis protein MotB
MSGGGHHRRGGHEEEHEEHENHERWLVSYADMMTLLMVLFIVLFAISQVDSRKFAALKTGLASGFGNPVAFMPQSDSLLDQGKGVAPDALNLTGSAGGTAQSNVDASASVNPEAVAKLAQATEKAQVQKEVNNLLKAKKALQKALRDAGLVNSATFRFDERGLVVSVATDNVLFQSGSAQLESQGQKILNTIGPTLLALPNQLSVDGHTNAIPISTEQFPTNWELSARRATGVLRYLHAEDKIPFGRMSATAFADTEPRLTQTDPRSVSVNRRVEIVVIAQIDDSAGRAIASIGNSTGNSAGSPSGSSAGSPTGH